MIRADGGNMTTTFLSRCIKGSLLALAILTLAGTLVIGLVSFVSAVLPIPRTYHIEFVNYNGRNPVDTGFEDYLKSRKISYTITYHNADRSLENLKQILNSLERSKADLIVTWGTTTTLAIFGTVKDQVLDNSGLFVVVASPVLANIVKSASEPGRNLTGSWHVAPVANQLRSMLSYKPSKKIGVLYTPSEVNSLITVKELKRQAALLSIEIVAIPFDFQDGAPIAGNTVAAIAEMKAQKVDWLYLPPDSFLGSQARSLVIPESNRAGIPTFASTEQLMLSGATAGLIAPYSELGKLAGRQAEQILVERIKPMNIPVRTVDRFDHMVNSKIAPQFGIELNKPLFDSVKRIER
jgi:putative tryptophan/tyrosine transport system substrate-binding protein